MIDLHRVECTVRVALLTAYGLDPMGLAMVSQGVFSASIRAPFKIPVPARI